MLQGPTSVMKQPVPMCSGGTIVAGFWTFGLFDVGILTEFFPVNHLLHEGLKLS